MISLVLCAVQAFVFAFLLEKIVKVDFKKAFVIASLNILITGTVTLLLIFRIFPAINYKQFPKTTLAISTVVVIGVVAFAIFWVLMRFLYRLRINRDQLLDLFFASMAVTTVFYLLGKAIE